MREQCLVPAQLFTTGGWWPTSDARTYLNTTWYDLTNEIKASIRPAKIYIRSTWDGTDYPSSIDKVFLLSEADVFGTASGAPGDTIDPREFTAGGQLEYFKTESNRIATNGGGATNWWLRSLSGRTGSAGISRINTEGALGWVNKSENGSLRPTMWIYIQ